MQRVALFDTSIASSNFGDQIIMESIEDIISNILPMAYIIKFQTHDVISHESYKLIGESEFKFVGGTNLLASNMDKIRLWRIDYNDVEKIKEVVLVGVGWLTYQGLPNQYTVELLKKLLSKRYVHSVRDSYTEKQLKSIGFENVINTACPTMWGLTSDHCKEIPEEKGNRVILTYTDWRKNEEFDKKLLYLLKQNYKEIYFWPQGVYDSDYMRLIGGDSVRSVAPSLKAFDHLLSSSKIDYIGTRLHGGIRALQHKKKTLILSVDNRAAEIAKDTNIPIVERDNLTAIDKWINNKNKTKINLPEKSILKWKSQF